MALKVRVGSSWVDHIPYVRVGSSWVEHNLRRWTGTAWEYLYKKAVAAGLNVNGFVTGTSSVAGASGSISGGIGCNPTGGRAPYTYSWVRSGSTKVTLSSYTAQNATISWSGLALWENISGAFNLTVTDADGLTGGGSLTYDFTRTS